MITSAFATFPEANWANILWNIRQEKHMHTKAKIELQQIGVKSKGNLVFIKRSKKMQCKTATVTVIHLQQQQWRNITNTKLPKSSTLTKEASVEGWRLAGSFSLKLQKAIKVPRPPKCIWSWRASHPTMVEFWLKVVKKSREEKEVIDKLKKINSSNS